MTQTTIATDQAVSVAAYHLWQHAGCPTGRDLEFWLKAKDELASKDNASPNAATQKKAGNHTNQKR